MNNQEAKFILRAYRSNGRDAQDPVFAESLGQAGQDPALSAWFEREKAFDAAIAGKIAKMQPPAELKTAILAGMRAGRQRQAWWRQTVWIAAAACIAVALTLGATVRFSPSAPPNVYELTRFAIVDTGDNADNHAGSVKAISALEERMAQGNLHAPGSLVMDTSQLKAQGCRTVAVAGHEVFEICFGRNHEFHIYIAKRGDFDSESVTGAPLFMEYGRLASATWADSKYVYALVTDVGLNALHQLL